MSNHAALFQKIQSIYKGYSNEYRTSTQPFYLAQQNRYPTAAEFDPESLLIREPLIEHVGSLPIIAALLYPHINDPEVDFGRALSMLAVHDIGELEVGDETTFTKGADVRDEERDAALRLLDDEGMRKLFEEAYAAKTKTAKFAKSVDKITPDILDALTPPEISIVRYKHFTGTSAAEIMPLIRKHKHPYMTWNPFLMEFHLWLLEYIEEELKKYY